MIQYREKFKSYGFNEAGDIIYDYILDKMIKCPNWTIHMIVAANLNPNISLEKIIPAELKELSQRAIEYILQKIPALNETTPTNDNFGTRVINV